jgi:hypothetical protein
VALDHRADRVVGAAPEPVRVGGASNESEQQLELPAVADERHHDLGVHRDAAPACGELRAEDRVDLHFVDLGVEESEPRAASTEHRVDLLERPDPFAGSREPIDVVGALRQCKL